MVICVIEGGGEGEGGGELTSLVFRGDVEGIATVS